MLPFEVNPKGPYGDCAAPLLGSAEKNPVDAQDGIKLAQALAAAGGLAAAPAAAAAALRGYERERTARAAPVTTKSWILGAALQVQNPLVSSCNTELLRQAAGFCKACDAHSVPIHILKKLVADGNGGGWRSKEHGWLWLCRCACCATGA